MTQYIIRRLLLVIPTLILVSVIVFALVRFIPGDVITLMVSEQGYAGDVAKLRHLLGFDKPIYIQYFNYMKGVLQGDFGVSLWRATPVLSELKQRLPVTLELMLLSISFSLLISIPVGVISAIRQDTIADYLSRSFAIGALSIPGFWLATIILVMPALWFGWTPPLKFVPFIQDPWGNISVFLLPAAIHSLGLSGGVMRMTRTTMLEVLRQDYIRTAWAKGLLERVIIFRHALKNALIPVITILGMQIAAGMGGTVIFESIFNLPGVGRLLIEAITQRDYPIIQGVNLVLASIVIFMNIIVDISYAYLDPRIRYR